jgi:hypothetical protein
LRNSEKTDREKRRWGDFFKNGSQEAEGRWQNQMMGRTLNCGIQRVRRGDKGIRGSRYQDIRKNQGDIRGETLT